MVGTIVQQLADLDLIDAKAEGLPCPRCKSKMSRGGLVNPLLLVDRCQSCGGIWLDAHELALVRKLLGLSGGPSEVTVDRPAPVPVAPPAPDVKSMVIKFVAAVCAILGLIGLSFEMYLYLSPAAAVSHAPSAGMAVACLLFLAGGIFGVSRGK